MVHGRYRHRRRLNFAVGGNQLQYRAESPAPELARNSIGSVHIGIDDSHEPDRLSLLFEFLVDAGVVTSKNSNADYRDRNRILRWQVTFSVAGCRKEIVNVIRRKITMRHFRAHILHNS
jgi:hypothetical protein